MNIKYCVCHPIVTLGPLVYVGHLVNAQCQDCTDLRIVMNEIRSPVNGVNYPSFLSRELTTSSLAGSLLSNDPGGERIT